MSTCGYISISYKSHDAEINAIEDETRSITNELNNAQDFLDENFSKIQEYQEGDKYELHDPFYEEFESFIKNETSTVTKEVIDDAKDSGLRCAYVQVIMGEDLYMYDLVAFHTLDKDMIYYEPGKERVVIPEIGKKYRDCVINNPQNFSTFNDTIIDIIHIW